MVLPPIKVTWDIQEEVSSRLLLKKKYPGGSWIKGMKLKKVVYSEDQDLEALTLQAMSETLGDQTTVTALPMASPSGQDWDSSSRSSRSCSSLPPYCED